MNFLMYFCFLEIYWEVYVEMIVYTSPISRCSYLMNAIIATETIHITVIFVNLDFLKTWYLGQLK